MADNKDLNISPESFALISAVSLSMMAPLIAFLRVAIRKGILKKADLDAEFQTALDENNYPIEMRPLLKPIWTQVKRLTEDER